MLATKNLFCIMIIMEKLKTIIYGPTVHLLAKDFLTILLFAHSNAMSPSLLRKRMNKTFKVEELLRGHLATCVRNICYIFCKPMLM
jgi:hypothetical protein